MVGEGIGPYELDFFSPKPSSVPRRLSILYRSIARAAIGKAMSVPITAFRSAGLLGVGLGEPPEVPEPDEPAPEPPEDEGDVEDGPGSEDVKVAFVPFKRIALR